jgi:hypothetical protein
VGCNPAVLSARVRYNRHLQQSRSGLASGMPPPQLALLWAAQGFGRRVRPVGDPAMTEGEADDGKEGTVLSKERSKD